MRIREAVDDYLYSRGRQLTTKSRLGYQQRLRAFTVWCEANDLLTEGLSPRVIGRFLDQLEVELSTQRSYAIVIRAFLRWCSMDSEYEIGEKWVSRVGVPIPDQKDIAIFTEDEVRRMMRAVDATSQPVRNRAILYLLLDTGARVSELFYDPVRPNETTGLLLSNLNLDARDRKGEADPYIVIMGKGRKERQVGLGHASLQALRKYLRSRPRIDSDLVFLGRGDRPLSIRGVQMVVANIGDIAGVGDCHIHRFRHTFSVNYLLNGGSDYMLMRILGHSSITSTQIYLRAMNQQQARRGKSVLDELF